MNTSDQNVRDGRRERSNLLPQATVARKVKMDMVLVYQVSKFEEQTNRSYIRLQIPISPTL